MEVAEIVARSPLTRNTLMPCVLVFFIDGPPGVEDAPTRGIGLSTVVATRHAVETRSQLHAA